MNTELANIPTSKILEELEIQDKKVYAYMPTWRGSVGNIDAKANAYFQYYLYELDKILSDDEIVYLNLHPIAVKDVDFSTFTRILYVSSHSFEPRSTPGYALRFFSG